VFTRLDRTQLFVFTAGVLLIAFILWYFFGERERTVAAEGEGGVQRGGHLGNFGIARRLPPFETTPIEFTPDKPGEFTFTCGTNMLRGKLVVEPA
jgi:plastocyanin domain-containing protein